MEEHCGAGGEAVGVVETLAHGGQLLTTVCCAYGALAVHRVHRAVQREHLTSAAQVVVVVHGRRGRAVRAAGVSGAWGKAMEVRQTLRAKVGGWGRVVEGGVHVGQGSEVACCWGVRVVGTVWRLGGRVVGGCASWPAVVVGRCKGVM